jgi:hypothetical protein
MTALIVLGGGGGLVALVTAVVVVGRGIFRQVTATEDNTTATRALSGKMEQIMEQLARHETDIAVLKDRLGRP